VQTHQKKKRLCAMVIFFNLAKIPTVTFLESYVKANCVQILSTSFFSSSNKDSYIHPTIFIKIHISSSIFFQDSLIFTLYFSLYGSLQHKQTDTQISKIISYPFSKKKKKKSYDIEVENLNQPWKLEI
jgi:hypothetical protein